MYDSVFGDGYIPEMTELGRLNSIRYLAQFNTTRHLQDFEEEFNIEKQWDELQPTLKILHEMAPHVENWVNELYIAKKIKINTKDFTFCAKFDLISRDLVVYRSFFGEQDGIKAAILCHEWRHSRQNSYKFFKYVFSILMKSSKEEIIENDAYLYEKQALISIYGTNKDQIKNVKAIEDILKERSVLNDSSKKSP